MSPQPWESADLLSGFGGSTDSRLPRRRQVRQAGQGREPINLVVARFLDEHPIEEVVAAEGLKRVAKVNGGEWCGPCPLCGGVDRLRVWPTPAEGHGRAWCRRCGISGDALNWSMRMAGMDPTVRGETGRFLRGQSGWDFDDEFETPGFHSASQQPDLRDGEKGPESSQQVSKPLPDADDEFEGPREFGQQVSTPSSASMGEASEPPVSTQQVSNQPPVSTDETEIPPENGQQVSKAPFDPATRPPPPDDVWPEGTFAADEFFGALEELERTGKLDFWQSDLDRRVAAPRPCHMCSSRRWWRLKDNGLGARGVLVCPVCHPPMRRPDEIEWLTVAEDVR